jgi:Flp pilus assembly protein TadB
MATDDDDICQKNFTSKSTIPKLKEYIEEVLQQQQQHDEGAMQRKLVKFHPLMFCAIIIAVLAAIVATLASIYLNLAVIAALLAAIVSIYINFKHIF